MMTLVTEMDDIDVEHSQIVKAIKYEADNIYSWEAKIKGPVNTPFEGGIFTVTLTFTEDYPRRKPDVKFKTPVYHPNVSATGDVCVDILNHWTPDLRIHDVLLVVHSLLAKPNPNSPLRSDIANVYKTNKAEFDRNVKAWINSYARS